MSREFGVGDLILLTNRLRRAGEDLNDAAPGSPVWVWGGTVS